MDSPCIHAQIALTLGGPPMHFVFCVLFCVCVHKIASETHGAELPQAHNKSNNTWRRCHIDYGVGPAMKRSAGTAQVSDNRKARCTKRRGANNEDEEASGTACLHPIQPKRPHPDQGPHHRASASGRCAPRPAVDGDPTSSDRTRTRNGPPGSVRGAGCEDNKFADFPSHRCAIAEPPLASSAARRTSKRLRAARAQPRRHVSRSQSPLLQPCALRLFRCSLLLGRIRQVIRIGIPSTCVFLINVALVLCVLASSKPSSSCSPSRLLLLPPSLPSPSVHPSINPFVLRAVQVLLLRLLLRVQPSRSALPLPLVSFSLFPSFCLFPPFAATDKEDEAP